LGGPPLETLLVLLVPNKPRTLRAGTGFPSNPSRTRSSGSRSPDSARALSADVDLGPIHESFFFMNHCTGTFHLYGNDRIVSMISHWAIPSLQANSVRGISPLITFSINSFLLRGPVIWPLIATNHCSPVSVAC